MKFAMGCLFSAFLGGVLAVVLCGSPHPATSAVGEEARPGPRLPDDGASQPVPRSGAPRDLDAPAGPLAPDELTPDERVNVSVYENVNRAVVNITTRGVRNAGFFMLEVPTEGSGSGSVIDKAGHILTNYHVVDDVRQVHVTLFDGKSYEAKFVGADAVNDLAVIKIDAPADMLHPVVFGDSRHLKVGMRVFAIGNPFGLERTLTTGVISSLNRTLQIHEQRTVKSIIQIDAAINPGNSGGPLLDAHSRMIGMNAAIATRTGQSAGVGFAIPVGLIARIVPQLIEKGRFIRPEIGISKVFETEHGLLIYRLVPGGPAERAGLQAAQVVTRRRGFYVVESIDQNTADLIVAVDGQKVTSADDFLGIIEAKEPGERAVLTVVRKGKELHIPVTLSSGE